MTRCTRTDPTLTVGVLGVWGIVLFAAFKEGFVRADAAHVSTFFGAMLAPAVLFASATGRTRLAAAALVCVLVPYIGSNPWVPGFIAQPVALATSFAYQAADVLIGTATADAVAAGAGRIRRDDALDPSTVSMLQHQQVAVDPWEVAVIWAYPGMRWKPLPAFQSYQAYTPLLDELNATKLRDPGGPTRMLRQPPQALDGRDPWLEAPATTLEMLCSFTEGNATPRWEVLVRVPRRCGAARLSARVPMRYGTVVQVPAPPAGSIEYARISGLGASVFDRAAQAVYRAPEWTITLDGVRSYAFVPGTADEPLLMAVPGNAGYSPPFSFGPPVTSLQVTRAGIIPASDQMVVSFYQVPLSPY